MNFIKEKRWSMLLLILVLTLLTVGCTPNVGQNSSTTSADISDGEESEVDGDETVTFQATILEIGDGYYLVEPVEGSAELNSADQIKIPMTNMNPSPEPEVGNVLEIEYDGWIAETYPAHLDNIYSISVIRSLDDGELERSVSEAIISENKSRFRPGEAQIFAAEYHKILKTVEHEDSVTVYLIALYAQYQGSEGKIDLTGAVCSPVSIVFSKDEHQYALDEYWVPEDGEGYEQSLRKKFPSDIIECALELELPDGMETCDQKARDYFGMPQDEAPYVSTLASALETAEKQFSYTPSDRSESIEDIALHLGTDFFEYLKEPHSYTFQVEDYRNLELTDSGVWWEDRFSCWRCDFKVELLYSGEYGLIGPCDGWCTDDDIAIGGVGIFLEEDGSYTMISLAHIP